MFKGSLRSKCQVDVAEIAGKFGGGGHIRAAGFDANQKSTDEVILEIRELVKEARI